MICDVDYRRDVSLSMRVWKEKIKKTKQKKKRKILRKTRS